MKITIRELKYYIEKYESGDNIHDWYDDKEIEECLAELARIFIANADCLVKILSKDIAGVLMNEKQN